MNERDGVSFKLVINTSLILGIAAAAITGWVRLQNLEKQVSAGVSSERIAKLEGMLEAHEATAKAKAEAIDTRVNDLVGRVSSLERSREWQRNRDAERR